MKKIFPLLLGAAFVTQLLQLPPVSAAWVPITAPSALLLDNSTNRILFAKTPHLRLAPASTTKLLTAIVALNLMSPDTVITIPGGVEKMPPSKIYLKRGERYRLRDLIQALLVNSANDAAAVIAFAGAHSLARFANEMNATAKSLGCEDSHFVNPSGLPDDRQYATAYDMALIMREAQRYPVIVQALKTRTGSIRSLGGRRIFLRNHNKMLWRDPREVLGKTGWTRTARHCFVGEITVNAKKVFVAMLGSHRLWHDLKTLIDYQFGIPLIRAHKTHRSAAKLVARENNKRIQLALKRAGFFRGTIDGRLSASTRRALKRFQKHHGLRPTGRVGSHTWQALKRYL